MFKRKVKMKVEQPDFKLKELPFPIMSSDPPPIECRHIWVLGEMDDERKLRVCVHCKQERHILKVIGCSCYGSEWGGHQIGCPRIYGGYPDGYPRYQ